MPPLTTSSHPSFTGYILELLKNINLNNLSDFIRESSEKIRKVLNMPLKDILEIKKHLLKNCGTVPESGYMLYKYCNQHLQIIPSSIKGLDNILDGGLSTGDLIEICGPPGSGKTQLCSTIAINAAYNLNIETLYIDTKHDFSSKRMRNILQAKKSSSEKENGRTMLKIKLISAYSFHKLIELLMEINQKLLRENRLKIIIIDSLPALLYLYLGNKRFEGMTLLAKFNALIRKMAVQHHLVFFTTNLITTWTELSLDNRSTFHVEKNKSNKSRMINPSLGKYWQTIPCVRLLIDSGKSRQFTITHQTSYFNVFVPQPHMATKASYSKNAANSYWIKILKSDCYETGKNCLVSFSKQGIIGEDFHIKTDTT